MNLANHLLGLAGALRCAGCRRGGTMLCAACRELVAPPLNATPVRAVDRVLAACEYEGAARALVLALKAGGARAACEPLAALAAECAHGHGLRAEVITWVPGRARDMRLRGFDHAALIAAGVARRLGLPVRPLLHRVRDGADQATLSGADRRRNPHGAFAAAACVGPVALVDDLVTTGATASACARVLRGAGASHVELLVPCRSS